MSSEPRVVQPGRSSPPRRRQGLRRPGAWPRAARIAALVTLTSFVVILIFAFFHRALDMTRGTPVRSMAGSAQDAPAVADDRFPIAAAALSGVALEAGHALELFAAGSTFYPRLYDDLRAARTSISFQPYYCGRGSVADSIAAILAGQALRGVRVRVVADGFGCRVFDSHYGPALRRAGVELAVLRPVRWYTLHKAQHRSHARAVLIDGAVAYTGGFGVDDKWLTGDGIGWRETNVRFTGPAVATAQAAFLAGWAEATGQLVVDAAVFPSDTTGSAAPESVTDESPSAPPRFEGSVVAGVQFAGPGLGTTPFERMLFLTIAGARNRLYISNAYFVPGAPVRQLLADAARRGVDVRILTAGARTDVPTTRLAARATYDDLLPAGVRIYEYAPTMMHAKTLVADGRWVVVGGMNFDNRSLRLNDELNLLVYDAAVGAWHEQQFHDDLSRSREITAADHAARSWRDRALEAAVRLVAPLL